MRKTEAAQQQVREAQRTKILVSARKIFASKGRAATIADIAEEAGMSQGLAYRYFKNKEEIFHALIEQALQANSPLLNHIVEMPGTAGEHLIMLVTRLVENRREQPEFHQLLSQVLTDKETSGELREMVRQRTQRLQNLMKHLIIAGQAEGTVAREDPDQMITTFFACLFGLTNRAISNSEHFHFPDSGILLRIFLPPTNHS